MKIDNAISIELHDGQRLSLSLKEAKELYRKLGKMLLTDSSEGKREKMKGRRIAGKKMKGRRIVTERSRGISSAKSSLPTSRKVISLSDAKRQEILVHFNKEISATPRTLSNILKGVSYSASQLPAIRRIIESQHGVRAKAKGKRILYARKKTNATATTHTKTKAAPAEDSRPATETTTTTTA